MTTQTGTMRSVLSSQRTTYEVAKNKIIDLGSNEIGHTKSGVVKVEEMRIPGIDD